MIRKSNDVFSSFLTLCGEKSKCAPLALPWLPEPEPEPPPPPPPPPRDAPSSEPGPVDDGIAPRLDREDSPDEPALESGGAKRGERWEPRRAPLPPADDDDDDDDLLAEGMKGEGMEKKSAT